MAGAEPMEGQMQAVCWGLGAPCLAVLPPEASTPQQAGPSTAVQSRAGRLNTTTRSLRPSWKGAPCWPSSSGGCGVGLYHLLLLGHQRVPHSCSLGLPAMVLSLPTLLPPSPFRLQLCQAARKKSFFPAFSSLKRENPVFST